MSKFHAIQAVPNHSGDFELIGIFTKEADAHAFIHEAIESQQYQMVVPTPEHLDMSVILDLLVQDRLRELAKPIAAIAAQMSLQGTGKVASPWT